MRGGLFVALFAALLLAGFLADSGNAALVIMFSASLAAIGATVMTSSGRVALRRIRHNFTQGWGSGT